jgi:hypothetical protein
LASRPRTSHPRRFDEFDSDAELVADGLGDVDVVADEIVVGVVVAERGVDALGADPQHAGRLHLVLAGRAAARGENQYGASSIRARTGFLMIVHRRTLASR